MAAAERLRGAGFKVCIYDLYDRAGGLLTYGIPSFKLEKDIVARRIDNLEKSGAEFNMNCKIGEDLSFSALREKHNIARQPLEIEPSRERACQKMFLPLQVSLRAFGRNTSCNGSVTSIYSRLGIAHFRKKNS